MSSNEVKCKKVNASNLFTMIKPILLPLIVLSILIIINIIINPSYLAIKYNSVSGYFESPFLQILERTTELVFLAIGMTLVTAATGGQDISVGSTLVIAAAIMAQMYIMNELPVFIVLILGCMVVVLANLFNGVLVAYLKVQPMIASLILFTAGRSLAAVLTNNNCPKVISKSFTVWGNSFDFIPLKTPILITVAVLIVVALILKFTTLGLYIQAVGINEESARLNGINPKFMKLLAYVVLGVCVGLAGFVTAARGERIEYIPTAKDIEMNAILAVAIGGNALSGGKFTIVGSVLGAYAIEMINQLLTNSGVDTNHERACRALVIIVLVVLTSDTVRGFFKSLYKKLSGEFKSKEVGTNV